MTSLEQISEIFLLEDNRTTAERRHLAGVGSRNAGLMVTVQVHRLNGASNAVVARETYDAGSMRARRNGLVELAVGLIIRAVAHAIEPVVVAGTSYGSTASFLGMLHDYKLPFVVQVRPSTVVTLAKKTKPLLTAAEALERARWKQITAIMPDGMAMVCGAAKLATVLLPGGTAYLFAAQIGEIKGVHRGTIIGVSSFDGALTELVGLAARSRWIRRELRSQKRVAAQSASADPSRVASTITARSNITLARRQDARAQIAPAETRAVSRGALRQFAPVLNIVELFSGAGGMGLGFLLGGGSSAQYRIIYSGEANPIFAQTLRMNHREYERTTNQKIGTSTPSRLDAVDLREKRAFEQAAAAAKEAGGAHFLIGGPPCQGFSMANRNSWSSKNPNNELVDIFIRYILRLQPVGFLMENVQGILWTPNPSSSVSVVDVIERRLKAAGYVLFPKLLDAVWYGVPQNRTRFFLMGLHRDLGYVPDDFGEWGPFPKPTHGTQVRPFVTVREAIADLPRIDNGHSTELHRYTEPSAKELARNEFLRYVRCGAAPKLVSDHVTSKHADYVIDRYRKIPAGGNWEDIRGDLTNYADVSRTHSNIYRRLRLDEPSITIGHYRKSMLIHPTQNRGLSLREAARLQSFPDWFRFSGSADQTSGGLVHKQQQLANAVCPLVTKAIAEFIRDL